MSLQRLMPSDSQRVLPTLSYSPNQLQVHDPPPNPSADAALSGCLPVVYIDRCNLCMYTLLVLFPVTPKCVHACAHNQCWFQSIALQEHQHVP